MNRYISNSKFTIGRADLVLPVSGRTSGTPTNGTITFTSTADLTVEKTGSVVIVSTTRANDALFDGVQLRVHTVVISCPNNQSGTLIIRRSDRIRAFGNHNGASTPSVNFYAGTDATMPIVSWNWNDLPVLTQKIRQTVELATALPTTGNRAMPTGLTYLRLSGNNINWTYTGAIPTGLTYLYMESSNINWTYTGALPTGLTFLLLWGNNINWTYTGALPTGLTFLILSGHNINWTYTGAIPTELTYLYLSGGNINWTGNILGNTGTPKANMSNISLFNYRTPSDTMDYADLISILNSLINNVGTLPTTVTIREQIVGNVTAILNAIPDEFGSQAEQCRFLINRIQLPVIDGGKGVTTFQLNTTNIPIWDLVLPVSGRTSGTPTEGTITFSATADLTVEATGSAVIVSTTVINDALFDGVQLRQHTVVISCPNNQSGTLVIKRADRIRSFGNHNGINYPTIVFYTGTDATMPIVSWNLNNLPALTQKIRQVTALATALPTTGNKALPTGLTFLRLEGSNIHWTYTGALPTGLTFLRLVGSNINWTHTGALPTGLTLLYLEGSNINWTYTGAMPTGLTYLLLYGNINWTYTGALPTGLTVLWLESNSINWTGNILGNTGSPKPNMTTLQLLDYRAGSNTMDYVDLIPLLNSVLNNTGTSLPATVIIREQIAANVTAIAAATADEFGTDAEQAKYLINSIKSTKGVTTFTLNTTNI